ncbi:tyrosine-type recombinase/integrase [Natranaeroarchaeum aerophilus]
MSLEPITPERALELYLEHRRNEVAQATLRSHKSRLGHFVRWCDDQDIDNLNALTGRILYEYRIWRRNDGDLNTVSEKTQMATLRVFVKWLESIEAVSNDLHTKVQLPSLAADDNIRDAILGPERAAEILEQLRTYNYASLKHVTIALLWHTMMRRGSARAVDVGDYSPTEQYIEVFHRPATDTPIKNQEKGERLVAVSDEVCAVLDDWIADRRPEVTDEYGREPLLASPQGRIHKSTIAQYVYMLTRPCVQLDNCPHDRDIQSCEAIERNGASKCPSSVSPHAIRRGAITHALNNDVPEKVVSDRADVGPNVLEKHYDHRSEHEKMEQRRKYIEML